MKRRNNYEHIAADAQWYVEGRMTGAMHPTTIIDQTNTGAADREDHLHAISSAGNGKLGGEGVDSTSSDVVHLGGTSMMNGSSLMREESAVFAAAVGLEHRLEKINLFEDEYDSKCIHAAGLLVSPCWLVPGAVEAEKVAEFVTSFSSPSTCSSSSR